MINDKFMIGLIITLEKAYAYICKIKGLVLSKLKILCCDSFTKLIYLLCGCITELRKQDCLLSLKSGTLTCCALGL